MLERSESELRAVQDVQRKTCKLIGSAGLCSGIAVRAKHDASAWVEQPPPARRHRNSSDFTPSEDETLEFAQNELHTKVLRFSL